jgi:hypothetical protein
MKITVYHDLSKNIDDLIKNDENKLKNFTKETNQILKSIQNL